MHTTYSALVSLVKPRQRFTLSSCVPIELRGEPFLSRLIGHGRKMGVKNEEYQGRGREGLHRPE